LTGKGNIRPPGCQSGLRESEDRQACHEDGSSNRDSYNQPSLPVSGLPAPEYIGAL
jgi:hypothetical protein